MTFESGMKGNSETTYYVPGILNYRSESSPKKEVEQKESLLWNQKKHTSIKDGRKKAPTSEKEKWSGGWATGRGEFQEGEREKKRVNSLKVA